MFHSKLAERTRRGATVTVRAICIATVVTMASAVIQVQLPGRAQATGATTAWAQAVPTPTNVGTPPLRRGQAPVHVGPVLPVQHAHGPYPVDPAKVQAAQAYAQQLRVFRATHYTPTPINPTAPIAYSPPKSPATPAVTATGRVGVTTSPLAALMRAPIAEAAPTDLDVFRNTSLQSVPPAGVQVSTSDEPSVSNAGNGVFYTGNYYAAASSDGGNSFAYVNPNQTLPPSATGQAVCCDQVTIYDPTTGLLFWELQYQQDPSTGDNVQRIAFTNSLSTLANASWSWVDFSAQSVGYPAGYWLDYPKLSLSANNLWMMSNVCQNGAGCSGSVIIGIQLAGLSHGTVNYAWYSDNMLGDGLVSGVQTQLTSMYFAAHESNSTLRIFQWAEGSGTITWADVGHSAYNRPPSSCPSPDNTNMCGNDNDWIRGGWVENSLVGFIWDAAQGPQGLGNFSYPYIFAVEVNQSTMSLQNQPIVMATGNAWAWGAVAVDNRGGLGMSAQWSAPSYAPSSNVLLRDDVTANDCGILCWQSGYVQIGTNGPADNAWGDYLTVRVASGSANTWVGTSYTLQCPNSNCSNVARPVEPRFVWFGRQRDQTPTP